MAGNKSFLADHLNNPSREEVNKKGVRIFKPHHHCQNYYFALSLGGGALKYGRKQDSRQPLQGEKTHKSSDSQLFTPHKLPAG